MSVEEDNQKMGEEAWQLATDILNNCNGKSYTTLKIALIMARDQVIMREILLAQEEAVKKAQLAAQAQKSDSQETTNV